MRTNTHTNRIVRNGDRGHTDLGWLHSAHTFSFGEFYNPDQMGFGPLRVINDDRVAAGRGFGAHPHRDMEIISLVYSGQLEHKDSLGNGDVLQVGDVQYMSAGTGVVHSEFNPSEEESVHFFQIWIQPDRTGHTPAYAKTVMRETDRADRWQTVVSGDGAEGIRIRQDARILVARLDTGADLNHENPEGRGAWLHVAEGTVTVNGERLTTGDAYVVETPGRIAIAANETAELILFDVKL